MKLRAPLLLALFIGLGSALVFAQATAAPAPVDVKAAIEAAKAPAPPAPSVLKGPSKPVTRTAPWIPPTSTIRTTWPVPGSMWSGCRSRDAPAFLTSGTTPTWPGV